MFSSHPLKESPVSARGKAVIFSFPTSPGQRSLRLEVHDEHGKLSFDFFLFFLPSREKRRGARTRVRTGTNLFLG